MIYKSDHNEMPFLDIPPSSDTDSLASHIAEKWACHCKNCAGCLGGIARSPERDIQVLLLGLLGGLTL